MLLRASAVAARERGGEREGERGRAEQRDSEEEGAGNLKEEKNERGERWGVKN
jgi:hypothetical protein